MGKGRRREIGAGLDSDNNKVGGCFVLLFFLSFVVFDTIVGFIIYTGCDPHNTLQGKGRMAMTRKSTNDARCIMIVLALVEFFFSSFFFVFF